VKRVALAAVLALAACQPAPETVAVTPTLACQTVVACNAIGWRLGLKFGPEIGGMHLVCRCYEVR
jgi:hypothetical protein